MENRMCQKFCKGPQNTNTGISCQLPTVWLNNKVEVMKHNPLSKEAATNLINNGGRHFICLQNPFRYLDVQMKVDD